MQFTKDNMTWCCGEDSQTKFNAFAFFPEKKTDKGIYSQTCPGSEQWIEICSMLGENVNVPKQYPELSLQNMVMGDIVHYQKLLLK